MTSMNSFFCLSPTIYICGLELAQQQNFSLILTVFIFSEYTEEHIELFCAVESSVIHIIISLNYRLVRSQQ